MAASLGAALAQDCKMKVIEKKGEDQTELMVANLNCATAKIEALESELAIYKSASGLVAAFNRTSAAPCPKGWIPFDAAIGRLVVGAGLGDTKDMNGNDLTDRAVGAVGGEEMHLLKELEMPSHTHFIAARSGDGDTGDPLTEGNQVMQSAFPGGHDPWYIMRGKSAPAAVGRSSSVGSGLPHNTMPPFVALYYCIKE